MSRDMFLIIEYKKLEYGNLRVGLDRLSTILTEGIKPNSDILVIPIKVLRTDLLGKLYVLPDYIHVVDSVYCIKCGKVPEYRLKGKSIEGKYTYFHECNYGEENLTFQHEVLYVKYLEKANISRAFFEYLRKTYSPDDILEAWKKAQEFCPNSNVTAEVSTKDILEGKLVL